MQKIIKISVLSISFILVGCATNNNDFFETEKLQVSKNLVPQEDRISSLSENEQNQGQDNLYNAAPMPGESLFHNPKIQEEMMDDGTPMYSLTIEDISLPHFINQVFAETLKKNILISEDLSKRTELVTLRVTEKQTRLELQQIAEQIIAKFNVSVHQEQNLLVFEEATDGVNDKLPLLWQGRTKPEIPKSNRPIFQIFPLHSVSQTQISSWLTVMFKGQDLKIFPDPFRSSLFLFGDRTIVENAAEAAKLLDQPLMKGKGAFSYQPQYADVEKLALEVEELIKVQGFDISTNGNNSTSILVIPVERINRLYVFAAGEDLQSLVRDWLSELDKPVIQSEGGDDFFFYTATNVAVEQLAEAVAPLLEDEMVGPRSINGNVSTDSGSDAFSSGSQTNSGSYAITRNLVVNKSNNALIYKGKYLDWLKLKPLIEKMDKPVKSVLIEVVIAEITLSDTIDSGIEWLIRDAGFGSWEGQISTLDGFALGGAGATYSLAKGGITRAVVNASATNSRISILSNPSIMVKNGQSASIDVGTEVPVITSQSTSSNVQVGDSIGIIQNIQYRSTGVLLSVTPVIHSGNLVDIDLEQVVSEAQTNTTSEVSSPVILNRSLSTSLTLADSTTVMLGGMIRKDSNIGESGVPYLKDIPIFGRLFKTEKEEGGRTELVVLITPYIIDKLDKSGEVTEAFKEKLAIFRE